MCENLGSHIAVLRVQPRANVAFGLAGLWWSRNTAWGFLRASILPSKLTWRWCFGVLSWGEKSLLGMILFEVTTKSWAGSSQNTCLSPYIQDPVGLSSPWRKDPRKYVGGFRKLRPWVFQPTKIIDTDHCWEGCVCVFPSTQPLSDQASQHRMFWLRFLAHKSWSQWKYPW